MNKLYDFCLCVLLLAMSYSIIVIAHAIYRHIA